MKQAVAGSKEAMNAPGGAVIASAGMLLPSTMRRREVGSSSPVADLCDSSAPATCSSQSAAPRRRRRRATSESCATPVRPAQAATERSLSEDMASERPTSPPVVVLDANLLYPFQLRNLLVQRCRNHPHYEFAGFPSGGLGRAPRAGGSPRRRVRRSNGRRANGASGPCRSLV